MREDDYDLLPALGQYCITTFEPSAHLVLVVFGFDLQLSNVEQFRPVLLHLIECHQDFHVPFIKIQQQ